MWKNYLRIGIRNLIKHKSYTIINLVGLSLGLGVGLLIFLFVQQELSYDQFHTKANRIFRVLLYEDWGEGEQFENAVTPVVLAPALKAEYPQVEGVTRMINTGNLVKTAEGETFDQQISLVSPGFFDMFDFRPVHGDVKEALSDKLSVVLTVETAKRYFGNENPMGKTLQIRFADQFESYVVSGVVEDVPAHSSLRFEMLVSDENVDNIISERGRNSWFNVFGETYVLLNEATDYKALEASFPQMVKKALGEKYREGAYTLALQPLPHLHLDAEAPEGIAEVTNPQLLWILSGIALLILLIACINFTTMAVGTSATRAKEVGVRKTMGAMNNQLFNQFMVQALLVTLASVALGILIAELLLPTFNQLFNSQLIIDYGLEQVGMLLLLVLVITFLSGAYPAVFLSSLKPIQVLKANLNLSFGKQNLRKSLVAFQFFISVFLISCTLVMYRQMQNIRNYDLGMDHEAIIQIPVVSPAGTTGLTDFIQQGFAHARLLKAALQQRSEVAAAGLATSVYGDEAWMEAGFPREDNTPFFFKMNVIDEDYADVLGLTFVQGRNFSKYITTDPSQAIIINEKMAQLMGWDNPIGQSLPSERFGEHQVIGVVKDFHFASLRKEIEPALMVLDPTTIFEGINHLTYSGSVNPKFLVKLQAGDFQEKVNMLESLWQGTYSNEPFAFSFLDETIQRQYEADERLAKMVGLAAGIALLIAGMGLFALASLAVAGRVKEIGIRKVLGASVGNIMLLLSKDFAQLILIALVLAAPLAYWMMEQWLSNFAFRVSIGAHTFLISGLLTLAIAWLTISWKTITAALANPVDSLRNE